MKPQTRATTTDERSAASNYLEIRLPGGTERDSGGIPLQRRYQRLIARVLWLAIAGVAIFLFIAAMPFHAEHLHVLCQSILCNSSQTPSQVTRELHEIGLESLVGHFAAHIAQPLVIVVSTLAIAALFQPFRHRIQQIIDRSFYRSKYDAARTLEEFSARLGNEVNLSQVREHLLSVVQETMQPTYVALWLRTDDQPGKVRSAAPGVNSPMSDSERLSDASGKL